MADFEENYVSTNVRPGAPSHNPKFLNRVYQDVIEEAPEIKHIAYSLLVSNPNLLLRPGFKLGTGRCCNWCSSTGSRPQAFWGSHWGFELRGGHQRSLQSISQRFHVRVAFRRDSVVRACRAWFGECLEDSRYWAYCCWENQVGVYLPGHLYWADKVILDPTSTTMWTRQPARCSGNGPTESLKMEKCRRCSERTLRTLQSSDGQWFLVIH